MKVVFYASDKKREGLIGTAFIEGVMHHGDKAEIKLTTDYINPEVGTDVAVMIGVKGKSRQILDDHRAMGKNIIYIDKGFFRIANTHPDRLSRSLYYKTSVNDFQCLDYLMDENMPSDRWKILRNNHGLRVKPWRLGGDRVIWLGPSQKYCNFHSLGDSTTFSEQTIKGILRRTNRTVVYRPKHSWKDAVPISGTEFSKGNRKIEDEFKTAWALVTHGSNSSAEAIINGIPVVALGPAIASPIANNSLKKLDTIKCPTNEERTQWLYNIAYQQWTIAEMSNGLAWGNLRRHIP